MLWQERCQSSNEPSWLRVNVTERAEQCSMGAEAAGNSLTGHLYEVTDNY
jgi:hypothetical protein